jgi:hypothetical protein
VHPRLVAQVDGTRQSPGDTCASRTSGRLPHGLPSQRKWRRGRRRYSTGHLELIVAIDFERRDQIKRYCATENLHRNGTEYIDFASLQPLRALCAYILLPVFGLRHFD